MALTPGARLGPYEILSALGAGGMGEVYRATDTKLKRQVAIKVLPPSWAADSDRLARFQREAEVLASLNHPNIGHIHGLEESGDITAIVMELVEGDDLSQRIARGAIPLDEALPIATQIAEALEAAHEQGIIHRDLKPANIKVRADGTVKILDFGLAKALAPEPGNSGVAHVSQGATITSPAMMTSVGMILGTAAYMSPEQASGKLVDKRADIWSFGVVLWEMLTGRRLFDGETVSHTLADVLRGPIEFTQLPADTPKPIRDLLRRCLNRDVKKRLRDIGEARLQLEDVLSGAGEPATSPAVPAAAPVVSRTRARVAWAAALGVVSLAALAWGTVAYVRPAPQAAEAIRFFISPPDAWNFQRQPDLTGVSPVPTAVSPDGRRMAFVAVNADSTPRLWVRSLDTLDAQALAGTDGASSPFWSPDSRFLGFFAGGKLKKIDVAGGPPITLCDAPSNRGGSWSRDGIIVFNPNNLVALQKVPAAGGTPTAATVLDSGETAHRRPFFLPDGRHFLYSAGAAAVEVAIYVGSLDSADRKLLLRADANNALYTQGHLLFLRETTLMAQPFDLQRLELGAEAFPIAEQIQTSTTAPQNGFFSASENGVLVYQTGIGTIPGTQLTWFDRAGKVLGTVEKPAAYNTVALSPDGTRVVVSRIDSQTAGGGSGLTHDLWVHEFARTTSTRLTFDPAGDLMAAWSPDGTRIAWSTNRDDGTFNLYQKVSSGVGNEEALLKSSDNKSAQDWSPDGRFLLYAVYAGGRYELWVLPLTGDDRKPTRYLQTDFNVSQARFSPDSRYIAYTSNVAGPGGGRNEVYVQPFPEAAGGKWMVSQGGGNQPRWRRDGKELFYISRDSKVMAVPVSTTPAFAPGVPRALFAAPIRGGGTTTVNVTRYDVTADGQKFLINAVQPNTTAAPPAPITVVLNWTAGLKP